MSTFKEFLVKNRFDTVNSEHLINVLLESVENKQNLVLIGEGGYGKDRILNLHKDFVNQERYKAYFQKGGKESKQVFLKYEGYKVLELAFNSDTVASKMWGMPSLTTTLDKNMVNYINNSDEYEAFHNALVIPTAFLPVKDIAGTYRKPSYDMLYISEGFSAPAETLTSLRSVLDPGTGRKGEFCITVNSKNFYLDCNLCAVSTNANREFFTAFQTSSHGSALLTRFPKLENAEWKDKSMSAYVRHVESCYPENKVSLISFIAAFKEWTNKEISPRVISQTLNVGKITKESLLTAMFMNDHRNKLDSIYSSYLKKDAESMYIVKYKRIENNALDYCGKTMTQIPNMDFEALTNVRLALNALISKISPTYKNQITSESYHLIMQKITSLALLVDAKLVKIESAYVQNTINVIFHG